MSMISKQLWAIAAGDVRSSSRPTVKHPARQHRPVSYIWRTAQSVMLALLSSGLFYLVSIYGNALHDPRYLDGWILAGGMSLQLWFHIALKRGRLSPASAVRRRELHIFAGLLLICAFISHSNFGLPDTIFEWALGVSFVIVTLTGTIAAYLAWFLKAKRPIGEPVSFESIARRLAGLAVDAEAAVAKPSAAAGLGLPAPLYDAWISELYTNHLAPFFSGPRKLAAHLGGTQQPLKRLIDEIDCLSQYVDRPSQQKLALLKTFVIEKDGLDRARAVLLLTKLCIVLHVSLTYALVVLTVLHALVVYAFSGAW